jgi:Rps23 Pro-64 3,4-dihydroxylase Tpa1-like proline 4-hydroxylase
MNKNILDQMYYWDSMFSLEEYDKIDKLMPSYKWQFIGSSDVEKSRMFWQLDLQTSGFLNKLFKSKVEEILKVQIQPDRLYANAQAHGQTGYIHQDVQPEEESIYGTLVYFFQSKWLPEYGGHLIFVNEEETDVIHSVFPKTNSAILFNSKIKHMALDPSVYCKNQRISIAYKFKVIE